VGVELLYGKCVDLQGITLSMDGCGCIAYCESTRINDQWVYNACWYPILLASNTEIQNG
jgi:hypothetical protein